MQCEVQSSYSECACLFINQRLLACMYVLHVFHKHLIVQHYHQQVDLMLVINHVKTIILQETSSWPINDDNKCDWILEN